MCVCTWWGDKITTQIEAQRTEIYIYSYVYVDVDRYNYVKMELINN